MASKDSPASTSIHQIVASWVFGTVLLVFLLCVFVFGPDQLSEFKQRLLAVFCALLAGFFTFFLTGSVSFAPKHLSIRAGGGVAMFLIILFWWFSPAAPIKVKKITPADVTARVSLSLRKDPGTRPLHTLGSILRDDVRLELRAVAALPGGQLPKGWVPRTNGFHLDKPIMAVSARTQTISDQSHPSTAGNWFESIRTFTGFTGTVGALEDPKLWDKATVEARLTANVYGDVLATVLPNPQMRAEVLADNSDLEREFESKYHLSKEQRDKLPDYIIKPLPIVADLEVLVEGKVVARSTGLLVSVWEHDEDTGNKRIIAFPVSQVTDVP